jgi:hypothetical protein
MRRFQLVRFAPLLLALSPVACSKPDGSAPSGQGTPGRTSAASAPQSAAHAHDHDAHDHDAHDHHRASAGETPKAHADHGARFGGVVTMEGDDHVEIIVAPDGAIELHVSDAVRRPIPLKDVTGSISLESRADRTKRQTLTLQADAAKGALSAMGPPPDDTEYTWSLDVRGTKRSMMLRVPAGGTAALAR